MSVPKIVEITYACNISETLQETIVRLVCRKQIQQRVRV